MVYIPAFFICKVAQTVSLRFGSQLKVAQTVSLRFGSQLKVAQTVSLR